MGGMQQTFGSEHLEQSTQAHPCLQDLRELWLLRSVSVALGLAFAPSSGPVWGTSFSFLKRQVLFAYDILLSLQASVKGQG